MYECQISTEPKISKLYKLTITGTYLYNSDDDGTAVLLLLIVMMILILVINNGQRSVHMSALMIIMLFEMSN